MKKITRQEGEMPVSDEIERELRIQRDMYKRDWHSRRYDYYCGDWRHDWHEERKVNEAIRAKIQIKAT